MKPRSMSGWSFFLALMGGAWFGWLLYRAVWDDGITFERYLEGGSER